MTRWAFFGVIFSLTPLIGRAVVFFAVPSSEPIPERLVGHGDLLLVTIGLTLSAVGEIVPSVPPQGDRRTKMTVLSLNILVALIAALWYGVKIVQMALDRPCARIHDQASGAISSALYVLGNLAILVWGIVTAGIAVRLSEGR